MMNSELITAIYQLYPQVTSTVGMVAYDAQNNEVPYDLQAVTEQAEKNVCKQQAVNLLSSTDWTSIPDVANPSVSNPYLMNQSEFLAYRSQVRQLAVNPVVNPVFPTEPTPVWSQ